jgi:hypothetical protein
LTSKLLMVASLLSILWGPFAAFGQSWPTPPENWHDVFNPLVLRSFNIEMKRSDWETIRDDETFELKVQASFWLDGEGVEDESTGESVPSRHQIEIRRKSATAIQDKVSYRFKFLDGRWHGLKTMSLENGDDNNVVAEGLAWHLHRLASTSTYQPGLAAWATLTLHLTHAEPLLDDEGEPVVDDYGTPVVETVVETVPQGVYLNVEFVDKWFLDHRGLWDRNGTWLYKQDDIGLPEIKESPTGFDSPTYLALDYSPFQATRNSGKRILNPTPKDPELERQLTGAIDMESMLRLGAVNAFTDNPDELFNKGKNFFWADFSDGRRQYFPWDLDATIRSASAGIYGKVSVSRTKKGSTTTVDQHPYQSVILNHPVFREQYNQIFTELLGGPMHPDSVKVDLAAFEVVLTEALLADPNNQIGNTEEAVASYFNYLRSWIDLRAASVTSQVLSNGPPAPRSSY